MRVVDVKFGLKNDRGRDFISVVITKRKTLKSGDEPQKFRIYDLVAEADICPYKPLYEYNEAYKALYAKIPEADREKLPFFPLVEIGGEGVDFLSAMNAQTISIMLAELCTIVDVKDALGSHRYSSHCLRRGGAQYRLFVAPYPNRMTLSELKQHGGWSLHENYDTLMKYIIDEWDAMDEEVENFFDPDRKMTQHLLRYGGDEAENVSDLAQESNQRILQKVADLERSVNVKHLELLSILQGLASSVTAAVTAVPVPTTAGPVAAPPENLVIGPKMLGSVKVPKNPSWKLMRDLYSHGYPSIGFDRALKDLSPEERQVFGSSFVSKCKKIWDEFNFFPTEHEFLQKYGHLQNNTKALLAQIQSCQVIRGAAKPKARRSHRNTAPKRRKTASDTSESVNSDVDES